jgi:hypothetical protein
MLRRLEVRLQVYGVGVSMTEERTGVNSVPEAGADASSVSERVSRVFGGLEPLWIAVLAVGLLAGLLIVLSDFATLRSVKVLTASCDDLADPTLRGSCVTHGGEEHAYAFVLLGIAAMVMTWGATMGRSRPAAAALAAIGLAVLVVSLVTDVPDIHKTGVLGERFEQAHASAGPGLWMEIAGGGLAFATGIFAATARAGRSRRAARERERRRRRAGLA